MTVRIRRNSELGVDSMNFEATNPDAWPGDVLHSGGRSYPTLAVSSPPAGSVTAGVRTQPIVSRIPRREGWSVWRHHRAVTNPGPDPVPSVHSSRFQPVSLGPQGNYTDTTGGGDWRFPARFDGHWFRAGRIVVGSTVPSGALMTPSPRPSRRVLRVPRFSTLPPEITPSGGA